MQLWSFLAHVGNMVHWCQQLKRGKTWIDDEKNVTSILQQILSLPFDCRIFALPSTIVQFFSYPICRRRLPSIHNPSPCHQHLLSKSDCQATTSITVVPPESSISSLLSTLQPKTCVPFCSDCQDNSKHASVARDITEEHNKGEQKKKKKRDVLSPRKMSLSQRNSNTKLHIPDNRWFIRGLTAKPPVNFTKIQPKTSKSMFLKSAQFLLSCFFRIMHSFQKKKKEKRKGWPFCLFHQQQQAWQKHPKIHETPAHQNAKTTNPTIKPMFCYQKRVLGDNPLIHSRSNWRNSHHLEFRPSPVFRASPSTPPNMTPSSCFLN